MNVAQVPNFLIPGLIFQQNIFVYHHHGSISYLQKKECTTINLTPIQQIFWETSLILLAKRTA